MLQATRMDVKTLSSMRQSRHGFPTFQGKRELYRAPINYENSYCNLFINCNF